MRTLSKTTGALVAAAACGLMLAPAAHAAGGDTYSPVLRQEVPRVATDEGAPQKGFGNCADIPADQDGWHFVLPGNESHFVKLTVTFEPGGQQVITDFGPPSDKHAYVASAPGAKLTSVVAEVKGGDLKKFNLSHTCPASTTPSENPSGTPSGTPSENPSGTPSENPSGTPSENPSGTPSENPSGTPSENPSGTPSETPGTPAPSETTPGGTAPTAAPSASEGATTGDLAETGSSAPVGALAAAAALLVGGGAFLVMRRRKAQQH
ncbi:LPXTG cell wall anchor domain-containing protein [Streptomyces thermolilacinus]|uniref:LPXTG cell wall anchor domain-containing protein n=1 Tax=Streptomyces thermolilacinus SPC6 TaxID=1306406 RepID=A0A1D3DUA0_9ACTN|nr:LPXTG cell wall anchor domain-containing protein [Streptomyces thermolilacinus]OEJ95904.1 LPXTG cell wall anchor domain-containing protein [Streptomyces thermolilacinus SPC6]